MHSTCSSEIFLIQYAWIQPWGTFPEGHGHLHPCQSYLYWLRSIVTRYHIRYTGIRNSCGNTYYNFLYWHTPRTEYLVLHTDYQSRYRKSLYFSLYLTWYFLLPYKNSIKVRQYYKVGTSEKYKVSLYLPQQPRPKTDFPLYFSGLPNSTTVLQVGPIPK